MTAQIEPLLEPIRAKLPDGYRIELGGAVESSQKVKLGEKTNVCEHCGWAFRDASTLVLHLKVHVQGQTQGPYPPLACSSDINTVIECHECGKRFVSRAAFSNHVKVHNPSLRFVRRPAPASIPVSVRPLTPYQLLPPYQTLVEPEELEARMEQLKLHLSDLLVVFHQAEQWLESAAIL